MRTDPQATEVRGIVEQVFCRFWQQERQRREAASIVAAPSRGGKRRMTVGPRCPTDGLADTFPRLFQPEEDEFDDNPPQIEETVLIDQGRYVARSYRIKGYLAMWLVPVGIVQFYDARGQMLATINLFESLRPQQMAA